jgi:hypothetical protein
MSEPLAPIVEENQPLDQSLETVGPNTPCGGVPAKVPKKKGRPLKAPLNTEYVPKPPGRPKKTPEEIKQYHKDYYEANKERIVQKRIEYRSTPNYKVLRHMQNERYKERQAQKPKVCLINLKALEVN